MNPIAERAVKGDRQALAEIVRLHYAEVFRFCSRLLNADAAEDAAQETFMKASKLIKSFRGESAIKTWLFGIALNVCRNERRKVKPTLPLQDWDYAENQCENLIEAQALREAMGKLPTEHSEVVILHEMEGLTYDECALALNVPAGTVKSRLHYAFVKLRELLATSETIR